MSRSWARIESILAASQLLNVNAGEAVLAVVKLPFSVPPFAGVAGHVDNAVRSAARAPGCGVRYHGASADGADQPEQVRLAMADPTPQAAAKPSKTAAAASAQGGGPAAPGSPHFAPETDVHLLDRLAVLYRYRHLCITVFVLVTAAMMIQGYSNVQVYVAQGRILIEDERSTAVPGLENDANTYYEDPEPYYQTQYKILKGRDLTRRVVRRLHLETVPEFNGTKPPPPTPVSALRDLQDRDCRLGSRARRKPRPNRRSRTKPPTSPALIGAFIGRVGVEPVRGSHLVDVTFTAEDPKFAAEAVNTLIDEYVSENLEIKLRSTQGMLDWLDKELANQQKRVEESEKALAEYREKENALSLDDKQNIVLSRLNQLNDAATKARTARVQKESLYNQVKSISSGTAPDAIPVIAQNPTVQDRKTKLVELQREKVKLLERYGERHPQVVNINASLTDAQRQLDMELALAVQSVKNEYETARLEEQTLSKNLEGAKAEATELNRKGDRLQRDGARGAEQPPGLRGAAHPRERAARRRQQPHQQRPRSSIARRCRSRRSRRADAAPG